MRKLLLCAGAVFALGAGAAHAGGVIDPTGDYIPAFTGDRTGLDADLDVTSFKVVFDNSLDGFLIDATFAANVNTARAGIYVLGVNTGTAALGNFGGLGEPNIKFNQVAIIQKTGSAVISGHPFTATITGNRLSAFLDLSFVPSTGFRPDQYAFNLWPRNGNSIADFAPSHDNLTAAPEPATWAMMLLGFGGLGGVLRRRRAGEGALA